MLEVGVHYSPRLTTGERRLRDLPDRLANLDQFARLGLQPIAATMLKKHWDSHGAAFGHRWAPWAPSTLAARQRKGNVAKGLLRDTDTLYESVFSPATRRIVVTRGGVRLSLAPDDPKWLFHQLGTSRMPERQVIPQPLPTSFRADVKDATRDFLATGRLRGAAGRFIALSVNAGGAE